MDSKQSGSCWTEIIVEMHPISADNPCCEDLPSSTSKEHRNTWIAAAEKKSLEVIENPDLEEIRTSKEFSSEFDHLQLAGI